MKWVNNFNVDRNGTSCFLTSTLQIHCVKSIRIWCFSSPYFPAFEFNTERFSVSLRIQSECDQKNSEYWHFSRSDKLVKLNVLVQLYIKSCIASTPGMRKASKSILNAFIATGIIGFITNYMSVDIFCMAIDNIDIWWFSAVNYFHKMLHLRCLTGFWIRFCFWW